jgi:hypothetical protein
MVAVSRKPAFAAGIAAARAELMGLFGDRLFVSQAIRERDCNAMQREGESAHDIFGVVSAMRPGRR